MKKSCFNCGNLFETRCLNTSKWYDLRKYCSFKCYWETLKIKAPHNKGIKNPEMSGKKHFAWKGDKVSYRALHTWVERTLNKPSKCEFCGKDELYRHKIHWANKSGNYLRDITDWFRLCAKCHGEYDAQNRRQLVPQLQ